MANKSKISYNNVLETLQQQKTNEQLELLQALKSAYCESTPQQLFPFVPIKLVGILEGFCAIQYQLIIDTNATYRSRFFTLINSHDIKLDADVITHISNGTITFGEYASMLISCNNYQDIIKAFTALLCKNDFADIVSSSIKDNIQQVFRYRHIFCHEVVGALDLTFQKTQQWIESTKCFIEIINNTVLSELYPNSPMTQTDMNINISNALDAADKELQVLINQLQSIGENIPMFPNTDFVDVFQKYRLERAKREYDAFNDGTVYSFLLCQSMLETTNELIDSLKRKYRMYLR